MSGSIHKAKAAKTFCNSDDAPNCIAMKNARLRTRFGADPEQEIATDGNPARLTKEYPTMSRFGVCVLLIVFTALAGCNGGPRADWNEAITAAELSEVGLAYRWQNIVPLHDDEILAKIWHIDENVYCLTDANRVLVFNAVTGERRWSEILAGGDETIYAPSHADRVALPESLGVHTAIHKPGGTVATYDLVIFNTVTYALVFDRTTGRLLHRIDFSRAGFAASTPTACDGIRMFVGSIAGQYMAMELISGLSVWKGAADAVLSAAPVVMSQSLYIASQDGTIYSVRIGANSGPKMWPQPPAPQAAGAFASDIVVNEQGVFAGSTDYSVYAIDPVTGQTIWRFRCGGPIRQAVQVGVTHVYALATHDQFYAIDLATGRRAKWTIPDGRMVLAEIGDTAYVLNSRNEMLVVDTAIGAVRIVAPLTGLDLFVPNTTTPAVFAAGKDGLLCCLRPKMSR